MKPDLSIVVTAHDEAIIAGPTMQSVEAAVDVAVQAGVTVERIVGLDNPTDECRQFFQQPSLGDWAVREFAFKDPFLARNALAEGASGRWIAYVDADDLVSENWFVKATEILRKAEETGSRTIVHPELNWIFDGTDFVFAKPDQKGVFFNPYYFYTANYYDMMSVYPLEAVLTIPYQSRDIGNGFGFQDWQWNVQTMAAGWVHAVAPDTVIFKRRRAGSVSVQNVARKAIIRSLEELSVDRVYSLMNG